MFISRLKKKINEYLYLHYGIFLLTGRFSFSYYKQLKSDLKKFKFQADQSDISFPVKSLYPCYNDASDMAGSITTHYFYQDLYVAQCVFANCPIKHIDIGSRVDGFVSHVASFRPLEVCDIRPLTIPISNVTFTQLDLMDTNSIPANVTDSISCLHALEHFGLGRYGDPINFNGYIVGFNNISKMLSQGGLFYFSVPIGIQRVEFHAHRVFSLKLLLDLILPKYDILRFSYIDDSIVFHENVDLTIEQIANSFGCVFGCGIFELKKK